MNAPGLASDTAIALGIAATAMPFAGSNEEQAERWLRILRAHGQAGATLSALGVTEASAQHHAAPEPRSAETAGDGDPTARVTDQAVEVASARGADLVATTDVLVAVMKVYGEDFDRVLQAHGTDREQVLARLSRDVSG